MNGICFVATSPLLSSSYAVYRIDETEQSFCCFWFFPPAVWAEDSDVVHGQAIRAQIDWAYLDDTEGKFEILLLCFNICILDVWFHLVVLERIFFFS